jgi:hypothetical protein
MGMIGSFVARENAAAKLLFSSAGLTKAQTNLRGVHSRVNYLNLVHKVEMWKVGNADRSRSALRVSAGGSDTAKRLNLNLVHKVEMRKKIRIPRCLVQLNSESEAHFGSAISTSK